MTEETMQIDDPFAWPFWQAAREHRLVVQRCRDCGRHQFHPRPFCLGCEKTDLAWVEAAGTGEIYAITTVRVPNLPHLDPPYQVALVDLDEGVRLLTGVSGDGCRIGARARVVWRERDGAPPFPFVEEDRP